MTAPYYADDLVTIYHGDCREIAASLDRESVDLWLADPPYGQQFGGFRGVVANIRGDGARQGVRVTRQALFESAHAMKEDAHFLVFCHWEGWPDVYDACAAYFPIKNALVWYKDRGGMGDCEMEYARDFEMICYGARGRRAIRGKRPCAVIEGFPPVPSAQRLHPNEKPIELLHMLIDRHCPVGGLVFDPFMGSGPVPRACKDRGIKCVAVELVEEYCERAAERCRQEVLALESA